MIATLRGQSLLSLDDVTRDAIVEILDTAETFVEVNRRTIKKVPALKGRVVASLFFEESTRTRLSFETAAKRLSADVLSLAVASSSVKKGESLRDTIATIDALGIDAVVHAPPSSGAALQVSRYVPHVRVINGGDGQHQHPTQGLLDAFTIRQILAERRGTTGPETRRRAVRGPARSSSWATFVTVASREATSSAYVALGAEVRVAAPGTLLPDDVGSWPVEVVDDFDEALEWADVVGLLAPAGRARHRLVRAEPSRVHDDLRPDGRARAATAARDDHHAPGPDEPWGRDRLARGGPARPLSIERQVANGVPVRMAVLYLSVAGSGGSR